MSNQHHEKQQRMGRRKRRVRAHIAATADRPRLSVFRSNQHFYAQVIDDATQRTVVAAWDGDVKEKEKKEARAEAVGKLLAERARGRGITRVVFDRGAYRFHGRVAAFAKGARDGGLEF